LRARSSAGEQPGDRGLDGLRGGTRVRGIADGPADHDVVGPVREGVLHADDALLVVDRPVLHRPDSRRHHDQAVVHSGAQHLRLESGGDDAGAARGQRAPRA
jgi:hypothetical protein